LCGLRYSDTARQGILRTHPLETFAVKMAHDIYFYGGGIFHRGRDATVMEESLRRVKPAFIEAASPYLGYVRGMHAFALGECYRFDEAQARTVFLFFVPCWLLSPSVRWFLCRVRIRSNELSVTAVLSRFLRSSARPLFSLCPAFQKPSSTRSVHLSLTPLSFCAVRAADRSPGGARGRSL